MGIALIAVAKDWLAIAEWIEHPTNRALFAGSLAVGIEPLGNYCIWNRYAVDDEIYLTPDEAIDLVKHIRSMCSLSEGE